MNAKLKKAILIASMSMFSLIGMITGSLAWFVSTITISDINGTGTTDSAYFAYGTGTSNDPFGISETRHLNNLAWLQYNGKFDDKHYYFELASDINVAQGNATYVIPPIGTEEHPFIGVFDGKGHTINNIKVTNNSSAFSSKPRNITYNASAAEIVGFFGVVGEIGEDSYSSSVNTMKDFTLDNLTVESTTANTLIGLAAGYANAAISGVKVGTSNIVTNGNAAKTYTANLSDYGLVGYTTKTAATGTYTQTLSNQYDSASSGDDAGWGGSIDMKAFYNRLEGLKSNYGKSQSLPYVYDDVYDANDVRIGHEGRSDKTYEYSTVYNEDYAKSGVTYDPKIGTLKARYGQRSAGHGIYYLDAGHYAVAKNSVYYSHTGFPLTDGTNYMTVEDMDIENHQNIINTQDADSALLWVFSNNRLTTQYKGTTYYLYRYNGSNTDLRLTTNQNSAVTLTKENNDGGTAHRYVYNSTHYLKLENNSWILKEIPTLRTEPTAVPKPTETIEQPTDPRMDEPPIWRPSSDPGTSAKYYYIYSGNNYFNSSASNTAKGNSSSTNAVWWNFGAELSSTATRGTIKNVSNSSSLYLTWTSIFGYKFNYGLSMGSSGNSSANWNTTLNTSTNVGTIRNADETSYYLRYNRGWSANNSSAEVSIYSVHQAYVDWQAYDANKAAWDAYDANHAAWEAYNAYKEDKDLWDQEVTDFPGKVAATYAMINAPTTQKEGPDYYTTTDNTAHTGMDFKNDQDVTYLPLTVEDSTNDYQAKTSNTGYIMGGETIASATSTATGAGNVRVCSWYTLSDDLTNYDTSKKTFKANSVYTVDSTGLHTINDTTEANPNTRTYSKYIESKGKIESTLSSGSGYIYGLHFTNAVINKNNVVTARYAAINGEEFTNYQMPANAIDFNLRDQGYINFFAGTYGDYSNPSGGDTLTAVDSFFSLHQIQRSGSEITVINEIEKIYSDGVNGHSYVYKLAGGDRYTIPYSIDLYNSKKHYILGTKTLINDVQHGGYADGIYHEITAADLARDYSGYSEVFDLNWLKDRTYDNNASLNQQAWHKAFYFEIPTNPGEYALGTVAGKDYGAYLMYLDIGANAANRDKITAYGVSTFKSGVSYPVGVDFSTAAADKKEGGETLGIIIFAGSASNGEVSFAITESNTIAYEADYSTQYAFSVQSVSGTDPPAAAIIPPANGTRMIYTRIVSTDNTVWEIVTSEELNAQGTSTSTPTFVSIKHEDQTVTENDIPEAFAINSIRGGLTATIAMFERTGGTNEFNVAAVYSGQDNKTVAVTLDATGITLEVNNIASGYTITLNGTPVSNGSTYPSA